MVLPEAARLTMRMKPTMLSSFVLRLFPLLSIQSQVSSYCVSRIAAYGPGAGADASRCAIMRIEPSSLRPASGLRLAAHPPPRQAASCVKQAFADTPLKPERCRLTVRFGGAAHIPSGGQSLVPREDTYHERTNQVHH